MAPNSRAVCGAAGMYISDDPRRSANRFSTAESCAQRQSCRNSPDGSMKEPCVTGAKFSHQLVHGKLEMFRVLLLDNFAPSALSQLRPICTIEMRIEILL